MKALLNRDGREVVMLLWFLLLMLLFSFFLLVSFCPFSLHLRAHDSRANFDTELVGIKETVAQSVGQEVIERGKHERECKLSNSTRS